MELPVESPDWGSSNTFCEDNHVMFVEDLGGFEYFDQHMPLHEGIPNYGTDAQAYDGDGDGALVEQWLLHSPMGNSPGGDQCGEAGQQSLEVANFPTGTQSAEALVDQQAFEDANFPTGDECAEDQPSQEDAECREAADQQAFEGATFPSGEDQPSPEDADFPNPNGDECAQDEPESAEVVVEQREHDGGGAGHEEQVEEDGEISEQDMWNILFAGEVREEPRLEEGGDGEVEPGESDSEEEEGVDGAAEQGEHDGGGAGEEQVVQAGFQEDGENISNQANMYDTLGVVDEECREDVDHGDQPRTELGQVDGDQPLEDRDIGLLEPVRDEDIVGATSAQSQVQRVVAPRSGVTEHKRNRQWEAHVWLKGQKLRNRPKDGVQLFLGCYDTEEEAQHAHDRAAIQLDVRENKHGKPYELNFSESRQAAYMAEHSGWSHRDFLWKLRSTSAKFSRGQSKMKGVTVRAKRKRGQTEPCYEFEAKITRGTGGHKRTCANKYGSEEEAAKAYDRLLLYIHARKSAVEKLHVITNFRPGGYSPEEIMAAGRAMVFEG